MTKRATVFTNDPDHPQLQLTVTGQVERFVTLVPTRVTLRGEVGAKITGSVQVFPEEKYPFKVLETTARDGKHIRFELSPIETGGKTGYLVQVENLKTDKGRYSDQITLKTDSDIQPLIHIGVTGLVEEKKPVKPEGEGSPPPAGGAVSP